jgi:hypothetical protein
MAESVFLSHAGNDKPRIVAHGLIQALQSRGLTVIVDRPEDFEGLPAENMAQLKPIRLGSSWRRELSRLLEDADVVLACWSNNYVKRFTPDPDEPSEGEHVRDEAEEAFEGRYLAHVVLDPIERFPPLFSALSNDRQLLKLYKYSTKTTRQNGYDRLVDLIRSLIRRRKAQELGSEFRAYASAALRFLDRAQQEEPLQPGASHDVNSGLFLLFGPRTEDPDHLYERFCEFTMPARDIYVKERKRGWDDIQVEYMNTSLILTPWKQHVVDWLDRWPGIGSDPNTGLPSCDQALAEIADQLILAVPSVGSAEADKPIQHALRSIGAYNANNGKSCFAYLFIESKQWGRKRRSIRRLIDELGKEMIISAVANFRFLIVIERKEGWWSRLLKIFARFRKKTDGPSSIRIRGRPIWYRLPDLSGVKDTDLDRWAQLVAKAWGVERQEMRESIRANFKSKLTSLPSASERLREKVLSEFWLSSKLVKN